MTKQLTPQTAERKRGEGVKRVYDQIRDEILDLTLAPGSALDEVHLAKQLAMSRTPIREALIRLAGDGLVTTLPNRTTIVSPIDFLNIHTFFDALTLMYRVTTRLAAQHHTGEELERIKACQRAFADAVASQDALSMITANRDFHATIAQAGRNPYYADLCCQLLDEGRRLLRLYYSSFHDRLPQRYVDEHDGLITAIAARDLTRADQLAKAHADQIIQQIQKLIVRDERDHIPL